MKFWKLGLCAAAASLTMGGAAFADDSAGTFSFNVGAASDYVFRGVSQTDENAQVFGGIDYSKGIFYAGAWASNVDFGDSTDAEVDLYVGVKPTAGIVTFDLGAIYYGYVNAPDSANWAYWEFKAAASAAVGKGSVGIAAYYSPEFTGGLSDAFYYELNGSYPITDKFSVGGAVGSQWIAAANGGQDSSYTTWNVGVTWAAFSHVALDLRYHGSDLGCGKLCDDRAVIGLKASF